jgi:hypothetical protein
MSSCIGLINGRYITVDDDDKEWVELEKWQWVIRKTNRGSENIYIESADSHQRYLHNLFFDNVHSHAKVEFVDGDPFNYQRSNLMKVSYYQRRYRARGRGEKVVRTIKQAAICVLNNYCTIAPTNVTHRSLLCTTCSLVDDARYERCLDVAAYGNWMGWEVLDRSIWCKGLSSKIEREKEKNVSA